MQKNRLDFSYHFFLILCLAFCIFFTYWATAKEVLTISLSDDKVARAPISARGTVLNFPVKPTKVSLGKAGSFGMEYVENDLVISPLSSTSRSNLFVYLFSRRFTFDLVTSMESGPALILVRDSKDSQTKVEIHER